nr:hypothetical protein [Paenibacillus xylanexedens]
MRVKFITTSQSKKRKLEILRAIAELKVKDYLKTEELKQNTESSPELQGGATFPNRPVGKE